MAGCAYNEEGQEQAGMGVGCRRLRWRRLARHFQNQFFRRHARLVSQQWRRNLHRSVVHGGPGVNTQYVGWGTGFMDYDNDGWTDIFQVNGHVYPEIEQYHLDTHFVFPRLVYRNLGMANSRMSRKDGRRE